LWEVSQNKRTVKAKGIAEIRKPKPNRKAIDCKDSPELETMGSPIKHTHPGNEI